MAVSTELETKYGSIFQDLKQSIEPFLLSSDVRSEGNIAIVKKFDFDFLMIFGSTSLPQSKNVFQKKMSVCVCACV